MRITILNGKKLEGLFDLSLLKGAGECQIYPATSPDQVVERLRTSQVAVVASGIITTEVIEALASSLRLIALCSTGYDYIDTATAKKHGIAVANVQGHSTESVAQHTFAMLLYLLQKLAYYNHYVKGGAYQKSSLFTHLARPWYEIAGKQWGIVGLGSIGRRVATLASAFGAKVVYTSPSGRVCSEDYPQLSLDELLRSSDIISIHTPLNEHTRKLVGLPELEKMKKSAYLLNLGRGHIVDEEALAKALNQNLIAGAALDVLSCEPISPDNPLLSLAHPDKLLVTPHNAWASDETREALVDEIRDNILAFRKGKRRNRIV